MFDIYLLQQPNPNSGKLLHTVFAKSKVTGRIYQTTPQQVLPRSLADCDWAAAKLVPDQAQYLGSKVIPILAINE